MPSLQPLECTSRRLAVIFLLGSVGAGCGSGETAFPTPPKSPLYPVKGKILLPDGKPLTEGTITFLPVKQPAWMATGKISPDGEFFLKTADQGDGAPEGEYRVSIESTLTVPGKKRLAVPAPYSDPEGSDLKVTVKSSPNDLGPIKLLANGPPSAASRGNDSPRD